MEQLTVKERDIENQRVTIGTTLFIKLYFNGIIRDLEDNGLNTVLEEVDRVYDSGSNSQSEQVIFDGN